MPDVISKGSTFGPSAVELYYGGQRLYPAPLIDWQRTINRNDAGTAISQEDTWTLKGLYVSTVNEYYDVVQEMNDLKTIFSQDGLELVIKAGGGSITLPSGTVITSGVYPFVEAIGIPERTDQFRRFDYQVTLIAKTAASGVSGVVSSTGDTWNFTEDAERATTTVNHTVNAIGINTATSGSASNALSNARTFVLSRVGASAVPSNYPSYVNPSGTNTLYEFQRTRSETVDIEAGSYEITETFVYASGSQPFSDNRTYSFSTDANGIATVTVDGTIQGYPRTAGTDVAFNGFYNAQSGFRSVLKPLIYNDAALVYTRYGGSGTLATTTQSYSITENRFLGTVQYSLSYTDDPAKVLPSGIVEQSITIARNDAVRLQVSHVIPQRRLGNLVQDIATPTVGSITITASSKATNTGDNVADTNRALSNVQDLINQYRPSSSDFINLRIISKEQTPDPLALSAQATVVYEFIVDLAQVNDASSDIILTPLT
jgi:hypothetical protein